MTSRMISRRTSNAIGGLVAALVAATLFFVPSSAQSSPSRSYSSLVSEWRMTRLEQDGVRVPYSGQIIFTRAATMSVQAMNPDGDAPDTPYTVDGYEAFYGTVAVERKAGTFAVKVRSAAARSLIGETLTRRFKVSANRLVLTPIDSSEGWRVIYRRVR